MKRFLTILFVFCGLFLFAEVAEAQNVTFSSPLVSNSVYVNNRYPYVYINAAFSGAFGVTSCQIYRNGSYIGEGSFMTLGPTPGSGYCWYQDMSPPQYTSPSYTVRVGAGQHTETVAQPIPGPLMMGGVLRYTSGNVTITGLRSNAAESSDLYLYNPDSWFTGIRHIPSSPDAYKGPVTRSFPYSSGTELVFGILTQRGNNWVMGPVPRNGASEPVHAWTQCLNAACDRVKVGLEDWPESIWHTAAGGYQAGGDYMDQIFIFEGAVSGVDLTNNSRCVGIYSRNLSGTQTSTFTAGESFQGYVSMSNTGDTTWTSGTNYKLGSQSPQDNTRWGTNRVNLFNQPVLPTNNANIGWFNVTAPSTPGTYTFAWQMLQDGVGWFGETCSKSITIIPACTSSWTCELDAWGGRTGRRIDSNGCSSPEYHSSCNATNNASCQSISVPGEVLVNESFGATVVMRNTGTKTWKQSTLHRLWSNNGLFGPSYVNLPASAYGPSQNVPFSFTAVAPDSTGTKNFQWRMKEGNSSFGSTCNRTIRVYEPLEYPSDDCDALYQLAIYNEDVYEDDPAGSLIERTAWQDNNVFDWQPEVATLNIQDLNDMTLRYEVIGSFDSYKCNHYVSGECVEYVLDQNDIIFPVGTAIKDYNCPVPETISFSDSSGDANMELESLDNGASPVLPPEDGEYDDATVTITCTDNSTLQITSSDSDIDDFDWDYNDLAVCSTGFFIDKLNNSQIRATAGVTVLGVCEDVALATLTNFTYGGFDWGQLQGRLNVRIVGGQSVAEEFVYSGDLLSDPPPGFEKLYLPEFVE